MSTDQKTRTAGAPATSPNALRTVCRAAFIWVIVFIAFHVYWYFGGTFGFGDASATVPQTKTVGDWVFAVVISGMFLVGALVPFALHRPWGRAVPRWILHCCTWTGAALLLVRGVAGVVDTVVRDTGLMKNGLMGMTEEQVSGDAHPSAYTQWSGTTIDLYFALGGVLFALAALWYRRSLAHHVAA
ncbi:DUF3995 domain-containing protein [Streptomyces sp. NPDC059928]|uniref:DUF3995 domain-containing protein n=1 Tax=unclassified Streptomyces TaxID=2593676 RepID=UPI0036642BFE